MDDVWDELLRLAPQDGIWFVPEGTQTYVVCDRASGMKILGSPTFYAVGDAKHFVHERHPQMTDRLVIKSRPIS